MNTVVIIISSSSINTADLKKKIKAVASCCHFGSNR